ncbi:molybdenum cofactor biosynthesis protein MoaE [Loktanella sp. S4079]|uniref:molybdenum cofactor biosynthesis protein MoaE n=1 Tax=Loktanella sp. S4079 TaxID=579483 RepID=UPI0005F9B169|nr:molybdenum cofactor biosynthesis protein MoaE [Loktanella sp. S4079]KJZ19146.1 molybdenum cofactor biosynthesis protein MoaE [Loktanella sp. S4079]
MTVRVQSDTFDAGVELNAFAQGRRDIGAIVSFTGVVRDTDNTLQEMLIEHYPGMTERAIKEIVKTAIERWNLADALVIHRFGALKPGAPIMMVATASAHRAAAFEAADFLMDYLKSRAPFWKKEITKDGAHWVDAKEQDEDALKRW